MYKISGEIVKDFQIHLTVIEERPIVGLKVQFPVIGELPGDAIEVEENKVRINFNLSEVEQVGPYDILEAALEQKSQAR